MATILIIDDFEPVRSMLKITLEKAGYDVYLASDGVSGIQKYKDSPADVVITDIVMPEKEGIETMMDIRALSSEVKIIAISGGGRIPAKEYLKLANTFGADRVFAKPVDPDELISALEELTGNKA